MPITLTDLIRWENEKDTDKFHQFLLSKWDKKDEPLIAYSINVLDKIHSADSLKYIIMLNQVFFKNELSNQIKNLLVNWGEPVIEYLYDHITTSLTKSDATKALYTLGAIDDELVLPKMIEIITKNINSLELDACKILQKIIPFSNLVDIYKSNNEYIRYATVKIATSYPFKYENPNHRHIVSIFYAMYEEEIFAWHDEENPKPKKEDKVQIEEAKSNKSRGSNFTTITGLFNFFALVMQDENVIVRFSGIQGLIKEINNAKNEWYGRDYIQVLPFVCNILLSILTDDDFYIQQKAIELLRNFNNDVQIFEELKKLYIQKDKLILEQLLVTLGDFKKEEMLEDYIEIYNNNDFEQNIRAAALRAIVKIPNKKAIEILTNQNLEEFNEDYLIEIVESLGIHAPQDTFAILTPFLDSENLDIKIAAIKSIVEQNASIWRNHIISFIEKNDHPLLFYLLIDYLKSFCDNQAKKIIIKKIVNARRYNFDISEFKVILQKLIGDESIRSYVNKIDVTNDNELQHNIEKLIIILDKNKR